MINPIGSGNVNTSIFYINDYHGKTINMERTMTASQDFDYKSSNKNCDVLKLSSGDIMLGTDININRAAVMFENFIGIKDSAVGNHEHDIQGDAGKVLPLLKFNMLANNVKINPGSPWYGVIKSSVIEEVNGNKYGIIGSTPVDLFIRTKLGPLQKDISVDNAQETVYDIQKEVDALRKQGVNKIILLSHLGNMFDKIIAQNTSGIDVILGGHSHELIKGVKEGENLFYGLDGKPVVITQAGKDGKTFGVLNLEFDKDGNIKKVQNNIGYTKDFERSMPLKYVFEKIFNNKKVFGVIKSAPPEPQNLLISPNPHGYFIADCMKKDLNTDIALIQSANIRGYFEAGKVDERTVNDIMPFKNELYKVNYSEKDIVDAIKSAAERSFNSAAHKPGIFYASGLKYSLDKTGHLKSLTYTDKTGKDTPIDINHPRTDKFYLTAINDYCVQGNDNFTMLKKPEQIVEKCGIDSGVCVENVLQKSSAPVDIKDDGRISIE